MQYILSLIKLIKFNSNIQGVNLANDDLDKYLQYNRSFIYPEYVNTMIMGEWASPFFLIRQSADDWTPFHL